MLTHTNPDNRTTSWSYTALGDVASVTGPRGKVTTFAYSGGNRTSMTSPKGAKTTWTHDASGWPLSKTDPRGNVAGATAATAEQFTTHWTYDGMGRVLTETDPADAVRTNTYWGTGLLKHTELKDAAGTLEPSSVEDYTYTPTKRLQTRKVNGRAVATNAYDAVGNLLSSTDATAAQTSYTYNAANQMATRTTPRGNTPGATKADYTWSFGYDLNGNQTKVTDPKNRETTTSYDELNLPKTTTSPLGHATVIERDAYGRVAAIKDPKLRDTNFTYYPSGLLKTKQLPGLAAEAYEYDADGNFVKQTSPSGNSVTTWTYDDDGRMVTKTKPRGSATTTTGDFTATYGYDPAGNLTSVKNENNRTTNYTYDSRDNLLQETTPDGSVTTHTYDVLSRDKTVTDAQTPAGTTTYNYGAYGNLASIVNGRGKTTTYDYSDRGDLTKVTNPMARVTTYRYDADGNVTGKTNPRGNVAGATQAMIDASTINFTNDERGLRTGVTTTSAASTSTFHYDADGRMDSFTDNGGTTTLDYNGANELTAVTGPDGTYGYTYAPFGAVDKRTLPSNGDETYTFDADGRTTGMTADGVTTGYDYDVDDQLTKVTHPSASGLVESRGYDPVGNIVQVKNTKGTTLVSQFDYTLDGDDNPTQVKTTRGSTVSFDSFNYDANQRLARWCPEVATCSSSTPTRIRYTFDENGNRASEIRVGVANPGTTTNTYNDADQLTSITASDNTVTNYAWNADGQLTTGGRVWDVLGRQTALASKTYAYNALDQRRSVTLSGAVNKYSWDQNPGGDMPMLAVVTRSDNTKWTNRYDPTGKVQSTTHSGTGQPYTASRMMHDRQGTVTDVATNTGAAAWAYDTDAFGNRTSTKVLPTAVDPQFGYHGAYLEPLTGEYHMRARDYSLSKQQFWAPDPIQTTVGDPYQSAYTYVNNQQTIYTDPTGLCPWCIGAGVGALIGGVASGGLYAVTNQDSFSWQGLAAASAGGAVAGAVGGATFGMGGGLGLALAGGTLGSMGGETVTSLASGNGLPSACEYAYAGVSGAAFGGLGYGGAKALSALRQSRGAMGADEASALVRYEPMAASRNLLGQAGKGYAVTPGGRTISAHAAKRIALGGPGRPPTTLGRVDDILNNPTGSKYEPLRDTIKVMQGKDFVVVSGTGPQHIVTVMVR